MKVRDFIGFSRLLVGLHFRNLYFETAPLRLLRAPQALWTHGPVLPPAGHFSPRKSAENAPGAAACNVAALTVGADAYIGPRRAAAFHGGRDGRARPGGGRYTPPSWLCHATSPKALRALGEALACTFDDVAPTTRLGGRLIAAPTAEARGVSVRAACGGVSGRGWPGGGSVPSGKTDFQRRRGPKGPSPFLLGGRPRTAPGRKA